MNKDRLTKARRSWNMSRIRGKDTAPEKAVRSLLHRLGYRFRLHVRIPIEVRSAKGGARNSLSAPTGAPIAERGKVGRRTPRAVSVDILLPKHKTAIFVHGCFWHRHPGCANCTTPSNRRKWWIAKLNGNATRDKLYRRALQRLGWRTVVVWECETEKPERLGRLAQRLAFGQ